MSDLVLLIYGKCLNIGDYRRHDDEFGGVSLDNQSFF
jgi:hypothetical protein